MQVRLDGYPLASGTTGGHGSIGFTVQLPEATNLAPNSVHVVNASAGGQGATTTLTVSAGDWSGFGNTTGRVRANTNPWIGKTNVTSIVPKWIGVADASVTEPVVTNGHVYVGAADSLYAFDAATGRQVWTTTVGDTVTYPPFVTGGVVYITAGPTLRAYNAFDGSSLWTTVLGAANRPTTPLVVANGVVYLGAEGDLALFDSVRTFDAATGASVPKSIQTRSYGISPDSIAVSNRTLYVAGGNPIVGAFDEFDLHNLWTTEIDSDWVTSVATGNGQVFASSHNGRLDALRASTGTPTWSAAGVGAFSAIADGVVYATSPDHITALDAGSGAILWTTPSASGISTQAVVANGIVYVGSTDGNLSALEATSGQILWAGPSGEPLTSLIVANGFVFGGSSSLHAFGV